MFCQTSNVIHCDFLRKKSLESAGSPNLPAFRRPHSHSRSAAASQSARDYNTLGIHNLPAAAQTPTSP